MKLSKLKVVQTKKVNFYEKKVEKENIKVKTFPLNDYIVVSKSDEVDLFEKIKMKVCSSILSSILHTTFHTNIQGRKKPWGSKYL